MNTLAKLGNKRGESVGGDISLLPPPSDHIRVAIPNGYGDEQILPDQLERIDITA